MMNKLRSWIMKVYEELMDMNLAYYQFYWEELKDVCKVVCHLMIQMLNNGKSLENINTYVFGWYNIETDRWPCIK